MKSGGSVWYVLVNEMKSDQSSEPGKGSHNHNNAGRVHHSTGSHLVLSSSVFLQIAYCFKNNYNKIKMYAYLLCRYSLTFLMRTVQTRNQRVIWGFGQGKKDYTIYKAEIYKTKNVPVVFEVWPNIWGENKFTDTHDEQQQQEVKTDRTGRITASRISEPGIYQWL